MKIIKMIFKKIQETQLIVVCTILVILSTLNLLSGFYEIEHKQENNKVIKELTKTEEK